jgi:hypothetical protein
MAAPEVALRGGTAQVKLRNPVNTALLSLIPFYALFWWYYINKEMAELGKLRGTGELGDSPATSVLAIVPGCFIIVPPFVTYWTTNGRILKAQALASVPAGEQINQAVSFILLIVFAPIGIWWMQNELNKVWARETEGGAQMLQQGAPAPAVTSPVEGESQPPQPPQQQAPPPSAS